MNSPSFNVDSNSQDRGSSSDVQLTGRGVSDTPRATDNQTNVEVALQERALRLEAQRLSVETLTRVHLESVGGTRLLVLSHQRLMFTLSLGTLAGVITLFAAAMRLQGPQAQIPDLLQVAMGLVAVATLTIAALLSAATLQQATRQTSKLLREPFPGASGDLALIFSSKRGNESDIIASVLNVLEQRVQAEPVVSPRMWGTTVLLMMGVAATAAAFAL